MWRENLIALMVLLLFLFFGPTLLKLLDVGTEALYISGGVLLFLISVAMIFPSHNHFGAAAPEPGEGEPFIVPLAVPFVAGPSAMATIMIFSSRPESFGLWLAALVVAWGLAATILMLAPGISRLLGPCGLRACERLMGMVLTVVAVQMLLHGLHQFLAAKP